jgi:transposase
MCKDFACTGTDCCQRRVLFNQPDFADQKSALEIECQQQDFLVLFLPKFHCELNPIEQCWGHAKRVYCEYPPSTQQDMLEQNMLSSLETVTINYVRK